MSLHAHDLEKAIPTRDDEIPCQRAEDVPSCPWCHYGRLFEITCCIVCGGVVCFDCANERMECPDCAKSIRDRIKARDEAYLDELRVRRQEESEIAALGRED